MTKALNEVSFGVFRVFTKVARFDRFAKYSEEGGNEKGNEMQVFEGEKKVSDVVHRDGGGVQKVGMVTITKKKEVERGKGRSGGSRVFRCGNEGGGGGGG